MKPDGLWVEDNNIQQEMKRYCSVDVYTMRCRANVMYQDT